MKRLLAGTTALVGFGLLASPAAAQLEITIGGTVQFKAGYAETDSVFVDTATDGGNFGSLDGQGEFRAESEIVVRADGVADNGLSYGAEIEILTSTNDSSNADETFIYLGVFDGTWGQFRFGDVDSASDELEVQADFNGGTGNAHGSFDNFAGGCCSFGTGLETSGDITKIVYFSPDIFGFRLGISYAPFDDQGESVVTDAEVSDWIEVGVNYEGEFGPVGVLVGAAYGQADDDGLNFGVIDRDDIESWSFGAQVSFSGFNVGAGYAEFDDGTPSLGDVAGSQRKGFNVAASYEFDSLTVGAGYWWNDMGDSFDDNVYTDEYQAVGVGATYQIAPGLRLDGDVVFWERTDSANAFFDEDGWVVMSRIQASF